MDLDSSTATPALLATLALAAAGTAMLLHAAAQTRLLRKRIASGTGTAVFDPATGFFAADTAWQCIRAEANRANRLGRPLRVWIGAARDGAAYLDVHGRGLAFELPAGATSIRLDADRICVVSCTGGSVADLGSTDIDWTERVFPSDDDVAHRALAFVAAPAPDGAPTDEEIEHG